MKEIVNKIDFLLKLIKLFEKLYENVGGVDGKQKQQREQNNPLFSHD